MNCRGGAAKSVGPDDPIVKFLDVPDELQRRCSEVSSTGLTDGLCGDTVGLFDASFESRQRRTKTGASAPDEPTVEQRFIRRPRRCGQ
jgi:hypothetical protein